MYGKQTKLKCLYFYNKTWSLKSLAILKSESRILVYMMYNVNDIQDLFRFFVVVMLRIASLREGIIQFQGHLMKHEMLS